MKRTHHNLPPDLEGIGSLLEQERAQLSAMELDGIKRRVITRASREAASPTKGNFMKSRLAIVSMLAGGLLMSGTGATLAVDGLSNAGDATSAQYGTTPPAKVTTPPTGEVLGNFGGSPQQNDVIPPPSGTAPTTKVKPTPQVAADTAQPARQVELGAPVAQLPFTGYAGITVLLLGLALLSTGLVLRRRTRLQ